MRLSRLLLAASFVCTLSACDSTTGPERWFDATAQGAMSASLSNSGRYAIVGSSDHGGSLWDIRQAERLYDWNHQAGGFSDLIAAGFSPEGEYAVTATTMDLVLWQVSTGEPIWFWSAPGEILDLAVSPNGDFALLGLANHQAVFFDVKQGGIRQTLRHPARVRSVALSADGRFALTGADDYRARFWDLETGDLVSEILLDNIVDSVALSPNAQLAFSSGALSQAVLWDTRNGSLIGSISGNETFFKRRLTHLAARFSDNGDRLLTGTASGSVFLWDTRDGRQLRHWQIQKRDVYGPVSTGIYDVAFDADSTYIAVGSNGIINILR
ncbi:MULTISPECIES: WD40 repeat domain-containing protein [Nitrincola]|uniref:Putative ATPase (AAA+ superfamily) n=1 Tax=Nitrincola nitratireducens TaxID=1229521 RepID=W9UTD0_9GAMM|nr:MULTISPECIES: hypothetical protein [Nitrincola]EXJ10493.1 putative ATPase (AAA+ superfamily) [Nitrincola nitratireducens]